MREDPHLALSPEFRDVGTCLRTSCKSSPEIQALSPPLAGPGCGGPSSSIVRVPVAAPLFSLLESQSEICRVTSGRPPLIGPGAGAAGGRPGGWWAVLLRTHAHPPF